MYRFLTKLGIAVLLAVVIFFTTKPFFVTGAAHQVLHSFQTIGDIGSNPYSPPIYVNGTLYGVTSDGSGLGCGAIYSHNDVTEDIIGLKFFGETLGCNPHGSLTYVASENALYGMALTGGAYNKGTIFKYNLGTGSLEGIYSFGSPELAEPDGTSPYGSLVYVEASNKLYGMTSAGGVNNGGVIFSYSLDTSTYTTELSFGGDNLGVTPYGSLTYMPDTETLVGTTSGGGAYGAGVIFAFHNGSYEVWHSFGDSNIGDGFAPRGSLTLVGDTLYGVTSGDPTGEEVLFSIGSDGGGYQILYSFFGEQPKIHAPLVFDGVRKLYGTTVAGGSGVGSIFSFDIPTQTYTVEDAGFGTDAGEKIYGGLTFLEYNGVELAFYGTTLEGGTDNSGVLFKFSIPDIYVDQTGLNERTGVTPGWYIVSETIEVKGVVDGVEIPISVTSCTSDCFYYVGDVPSEGPSLAAQEAVLEVGLGDKVSFIVKANDCGTTNSGTLDIGGVSFSFVVTTEACSGGGGGDTTAPTVSFSMPATSTSLTVPLTFSATDNVDVSEALSYLVTQTNAVPDVSGIWDNAPLMSYTFASYGTKTLYAWAKDTSNNISSPASATVVITEPVTPPAPDPDPTPPPSNNNANPRSSSVRVNTTNGMTRPTTPTSPAMPITPSPVDSGTPLIKKITQTPITVLDSPIKQAIKRNFTPAQVAVIEVSLKAIVAIVTTIGGAIVLASVLFLNPLARPEFILIPLRLWSMLLVLLGIRKKPIPWGTVYDSITKQPLDPVRVSLVDIDGNVVETSITDTSGRYGFAAKPGIYKVVLSKTNYLFPSHVIAQNDMRDELYDKPYFGDYLPYDPAAPITKNIPLDPLDFDTALFAQKQGDLSIHYSKREMVADRVFNTMLLTTFLIVAASVIVYPEPYNLAILGLYIASFILRRHQKRLKQMGRIYDLYGKPLAGVLIKVYSAVDQSLVKTIKTTRAGRYYLHVPKGLYYLRIERKSTDGLMVPVYQFPELLIRYGLLNKVFNIAYS